MRKIELLKFEKAKKEYPESVEDMHVLTVRYYFDVVRADIIRTSMPWLNTGTAIFTSED